MYINYMALPKAKTKDGEIIIFGKKKFTVKSDNDTSESNPKAAIAALRDGLKAGVFSELLNTEDQYDNRQGTKQ